MNALLGEGGMGKVWRVRHRAPHRDDALKVRELLLVQNWFAEIASAVAAK